MVSPKTARILAVLIALFVLTHPALSLFCDLGAYATDDSVGARINAASGLVDSVRPNSDAHAAGLRSGDRIDFSRTVPFMHLWLWDSWYPVGKPLELPFIRDGQAGVARIVATTPPLDAAKVSFDALSILFSAVVMLLACAGVFKRVDALTLSFYAFCLNGAAGHNIAWLVVSPPGLTPLAALEAVFPVASTTIGFIFLCLRYPTGTAVGPWKVVDRLVIPFGILLALVYYLHFFESAYVTGNTGSLYVLSNVLVVVSSCVGLAAYVWRFREAHGPEITRMRWVAAAIVVYIAAQVTFFIDQVVTHAGTPWVTWFYVFNPAPIAFAYALIQGHIIDIRIAGGRAIIYTLVTSIPVALLAFADWLFARRLEDARLATVFEIAIAVGFSFWLRALHKRIDRFAERVFFASRHRAFQRVHHLTQALPHTEKIETIESLLTEETASALRFFSAAVFRAENGSYVRTASTGWNGGAETLDADDPIVLFARSAHRGLHLSDAPQSKAALPAGDDRPVYVLPIVVGRRIIATALYGGHRDGEAIDAEEEQLLTGLAHAAATAYEHLHAIERERENAELRSKLAQLGAG